MPNPTQSKGASWLRISKWGLRISRLAESKSEIQIPKSEIETHATTGWIAAFLSKSNWQYQKEKIMKRFIFLLACSLVSLFFLTGAQIVRADYSLGNVAAGTNPNSVAVNTGDE